MCKVKFSVLQLKHICSNLWELKFYGFKFLEFKFDKFHLLRKLENATKIGCRKYAYNISFGMIIFS